MQPEPQGHNQTVYASIEKTHLAATVTSRSTTDRTTYSIQVTHTQQRTDQVPSPDLRRDGFK